MTPDKLLTELSIKIYEEPLVKMRYDDSIGDTSRPLHVVALIIDLFTEIDMNGINNWFGNSNGVYVHQTVDAIEKIGAKLSAKQLFDIVSIAENAGMTYENIQKQRQGLDEYAVTSWNEMHGDKWNDASERIDEIEEQLDRDVVWDKLGTYVESNFDELFTDYKNAIQQNNS